MSFVQMLRTATAADHDAVDAAYGRFDLSQPADYLAFLIAHARALPAVEAALRRRTDLPPWRERQALLAADLAQLDAAMPAPLPFAAAGAAAWGALYVIEGSRLGGQLLARGVPADAPSAYLAARHLPGEWRGLLGEIERRADREDDAWRAAALRGARDCFALYGMAAEHATGR